MFYEIRVIVRFIQFSEVSGWRKNFYNGSLFF